MRQFTIKVMKCEDCPYAEYDALSDFCVKTGDEKTINENKSWITPSCPMWSETVEVSE